ncbi:TldD/PmbA family protein [Myxococcota bacterium]|nr:TldD/PmbA family protein [Myxococcota bacterium]
MSVDILEMVLSRAQKAGATQVDALLIRSNAIETRVRKDEIDFVKQSSERSLGLRAMIETRDGICTAVTSTSDLSTDSLIDLVDATANLAKATAPDPFAGLPQKEFVDDNENLELFDENDKLFSVDNHIEEARTAELAARNHDDRISNSEGSESSAEFLEIHYANSKDFFGTFSSARHSLFSMPIAKENGSMQTDFWATTARKRSALENAELVGRRAAERAIRRLGAVKVPTCEVPVIFDPLTSRSILSHVGTCVTGSAVYRKTSFLANKLGDNIANSMLTIIDDGRLKGGLGSRPFDGEGLPTRRIMIVENGRLNSFLLDTYSAKKLNLTSTGSASRSASSRPSPAPSNIWIEPGELPPEKLISEVGNGLYVTSLFGHGFNPTTGDFSRGAAGLWISEGEISHPVEEITIAGNLSKMLLSVDGIGNDLLWQGNIAAPTIRISEMTVAGES